jgi:hypothetical protein
MKKRATTAALVLVFFFQVLLFSSEQETVSLHKADMELTSVECALKMVCKSAFKLGTTFTKVDVNWTNIIIKTTLGENHRFILRNEKKIRHTHLSLGIMGQFSRYMS